MLLSGPNKDRQLYQYLVWEFYRACMFMQCHGKKCFLLAPDRVVFMLPVGHVVKILSDLSGGVSICVHSDKISYELNVCNCILISRLLKFTRATF